MAPQAPRRSSRPGSAGARLEKLVPRALGVLALVLAQAPRRSSRPGSAGARLEKLVPRALGVLALVLAAAVPVLTANTYYLFVAMTIGITVVVATGLNILAGVSGQVSLGQAGFYALGAYVGAIVATRLGLSFWIALPLGAVVGAAVGVVLALASLRVTGPYLAMVTIAFGIIVEHGLIEWDALTQGFGGIADIPRPRLGPLELTLPRYYYVVLLAVLASLALARNLERSAWGRALVAVRESEIASESLGLSPYVLRTAAFTLGAAFAAVGGCLYAFLAGFVSPDSFTMQTSILFLLVILFGGLGRVMGPVVGAIVLIVLPELLHQFSSYRLILYGVLLLGSIYFLPGGVVGALSGRRTRPRDGEVAAEPWRPARTQGRALRAQDLEIHFGGIAALADADLTLSPGTVHGLIGPNGAGKTTLLNLLTGYYRPAAGHIRLGDIALEGAPPHRIARAGVGRTFQTTQLFEAMTVVENVEVGLAGQRIGRVWSSLVATRAVRARERRLRAGALGLLAFVGYTGDPDELARNLPFGHKRLVEIARALGRRPEALLLDEPAAGLSQAEIDGLADLIARIRTSGTAVLLVGHHMDLVMGASDRVTVLNYGRKIAEGPPATIQRDPAVLEAYLGESAAAPSAGRERAVPSGARPLLEVTGLTTAYGRMAVLHDIGFRVDQGEIVVVIGANGAGKTTTLKTIAGLLRPRHGTIRFAGEDIGGRPADWVARHGVGLVPEGRLIFSDQTVLDNLRLGAYGRRGSVADDIERHFARFPILRERRDRLAGTLSGGEQQMLAISRALMARPRLVLLDEPSLGLAPRLVREVFEALAKLREEGLTLLIVEQLAEAALGIADRAYVLEQGRLVLEGRAADLLRNEDVTRAYLGRARADA